VFLVVGTSGLVQRAANLHLVAMEQGAQPIEINPDPTPLTPRACGDRVSDRDRRQGHAGDRVRRGRLQVSSGLWTWRANRECICPAVSIM